MNRQPKFPTEPRFPAQLRAAGISDEMLRKAVETTNRLCSASGPLKGGTLDPRSGLEYRELLVSIAKGVAR